MAQRILYYSIVIQLFLFSTVAKCQQEQWSADELRRANTAASAYYMTEQERDVLLYMNLARMYPQKYARVEVEPYNSNSSYKTSLLVELRNRRPVGPLNPDKNMFEYAQCWAAESGRLGLEGHNRVNCAKMHFCSAECCAYDGKGNGQHYVLILLIDDGVPSLGHRKNILNSEYDKAGASIQPHTRYGYCCVIDYGCVSRQQPAKQSTTKPTTSPQSKVRNTTPQQRSITVYTEKISRIDRFYNENGRSYLSLFSGWGAFGKGQLFICGFGSLGIRARLFNLNPLDFDIFFPYDERTQTDGDLVLAYRPTAGATIPIGDYYAIKPYIGVSVNVKHLPHLFDNDDNPYYFQNYDTEDAFAHYFYSILGVSFNIADWIGFYTEARSSLNSYAISTFEDEWGVDIYLGVRFSLGFRKW